MPSRPMIMGMAVTGIGLGTMVVAFRGGFAISSATRVSDLDRGQASSCWRACGHHRRGRGGRSGASGEPDTRAPSAGLGRHPEYRSQGSVLVGPVLFPRLPTMMDDFIYATAHNEQGEDQSSTDPHGFPCSETANETHARGHPDRGSGRETLNVPA